MATTVTDFDVDDSVFAIREFSILKVKITQISIQLYKLTDLDGNTTLTETVEYWCESSSTDQKGLVFSDDDMFETFQEAADELEQRL